MRVLVTGNQGYIGTVMVPMLVSAGHEVVGLDTNLYEACGFGPQPIAAPTLRKDIRDVTAADLKGFEAVIHLAALSNDPLGDLNPELTYEINFRASVRLAELAKQAGVARFIFSSSCSNYGAAGDEPVNEESTLNPVTPYGISKARVEEEVSKLADRDFSPTFMRSATAYGVSPRLRFDLVLNNLVAWALTTGKVHLKSDGSAWRPIVHIEDISRAFIAALEAPRQVVHNQAFNVGQTLENYRVRQLAELVSFATGCELEFAAGAGPDVRNYRVNCDKIRRDLPSFTPRWTASQGIIELLEAYRRLGVDLDEFEGPRYKRIAHIQHLIDTGKIDSALRWTVGERVMGTRA